MATSISGCQPDNHFPIEDFNDRIMGSSQTPSAYIIIGAKGIYVLAGRYKLINGKSYPAGTAIHPDCVKQFILADFLGSHPEYSTSTTVEAAASQLLLFDKLKQSVQTGESEPAGIK